MTKNLLKIIVSVAISVVAGYLALRNVQLDQVMAGIKQADVISVAVVVILLTAAQVLRSVRWGLLLAPLERFGQSLLLPVTCIGFLFVWILPARLGDLTEMRAEFVKQPERTSGEILGVSRAAQEEQQQGV